MKIVKVCPQVEAIVLRLIMTLGAESSDSQDTKQSLDDKSLYGNSSYEGHDTIYNAFSRKEIDDINEG
jgi:hypothetical protein